MLSSLHIENIAVIKSLDIDFSSGFTVLTGETGAGKSIIIDCIGLLLGNRADRELIRHGEEKATVTGIFSLITDELAKRFCEYGFEIGDGEASISRTLFSDGRSQTRINGRQATLSMQKELAAQLINIHGQHDSHSLLDPKTHIHLLDGYAGNEELLAEYAQQLALLKEAKKKLAEAQKEQKEREKNFEILKFQIKDIESVSPKAGESERLEEEKKKLLNLERITKQAGFAYRALYGGEKTNAFLILDRSAAALLGLSDIIPDFAAYAEKLTNMKYEIEDIAERAREYADYEGGDPTERLNRTEARLDVISRLKKKYGESEEEILLFLSEAKAKLETLEGLDGIIEELKIKYTEAAGKTKEAADRLSKARKEAAEKLSTEICENLGFLDMQKVIFSVNIKESCENENREVQGEVFGRHGKDEVEFCISQSGEEPKSISKIASGGELSRIMLAMKSVFAEKDGIGTVIFDEIDAGVSGKTARRVGIKLAQSATSCQVICVTHSAQIASLADTHLLIKKNYIGDAFETSVREISGEARTDELARILGGLNVTESQRQAALDMLTEKAR